MGLRRGKEAEREIQGKERKKAKSVPACLRLLLFMQALLAISPS